MVQGAAPGSYMNIYAGPRGCTGLPKWFAICVAACFFLYLIFMVVHLFLR